MRFSIPALTLALASTINGLTIPANLPHGVYVATELPSGAHNFTFLTSIPLFNASNTDSKLTLNARATTWPYRTSPSCSPQAWLPQHDFYDGAYNAFYSQCASLGDTRIPAYSKIFSYWDGAVAYMCAYDANPCNTQEWVDAVNWVQNSCAGRDAGFMQPGWLSIPEWKKAYGYASSASQFC